MNAYPEDIPARPQEKHSGRPGALISLALATAAIAAMMFIGVYFALTAQAPGPEQPVSFSHHVHAAVKGISCYVCHEGAQDTARAGMPPLQTCMLCHEHIIITHPQVLRVRQAHAASRPIAWERVTNLPEYVQFNHQAHLRRGVDCSRCHGDVKSMDRVFMPWDLKMGFCVQCHRDNNATIDCMVCHH
ncbi:MAG: cytochrome c3 family protein [Planctomycetaceae bacterium]|nr:cytochrome c family protein [Planctomycetaceae bacterium]